MQAAEMLAADGINAKVINIHTIKPLDEELVVASAKECKKVVTVEEHSIIGGLGSAVCDTLCANYPTPVLKIGVNDVYGESGPAVQLVKKYGLEKRIVFSSFLHSSITLLRKLAPEIPCGALVEYDDLGNPGYYCEKFDFQYYHPGVKALTEEMVKSCREHGIPLNVWTINDMGALEQMYEWGVEGVISNYPGVCKGWIDSKK